MYLIKAGRSLFIHLSPQLLSNAFSRQFGSVHGKNDSSKIHWLKNE